MFCVISARRSFLKVWLEDAADLLLGKVHGDGDHLVCGGAPGPAGCGGLQATGDRAADDAAGGGGGAGGGAPQSRHHLGVAQSAPSSEQVI